MSRDENDRPYEAGSPQRDLTGDVLSDRWTPDSADTDEQPAVVVEDTPALPVTGAIHAIPVDRPVEADDRYQPRDESAETPAQGYLASDDALLAQGYRPAGEQGAGEARYLPLDLGYEADADEPSRGFLGSGWTEEQEAGGEVRRRTKVLLVGAAAVVLVGAMGGWLLSGSSSDGACAGAGCASIGQVAPSISEAPLPEPEPTEAEPELTPEASATESETPDPVVDPPRATRTPTPRATPTRIGTPTRQATAKPQETLRGETGQQEEKSTPEQQVKPEPTEEPTQETAPTQEPPIQNEQPEEKRGGGLLDWLLG